MVGRQGRGGRRGGGVLEWGSVLILEGGRCAVDMVFVRALHAWAGICRSISVGRRSTAQRVLVLCAQGAKFGLRIEFAECWELASKIEEAAYAQAVSVDGSPFPMTFRHAARQCSSNVLFALG
ncbi:unnamed protein product [Ostreobium quekettii]|uniref:Uncharacterized protein n=1 Tax=Ostreobium quekettii TaxID=121088 RepID=A0A8S1JEK9_9CHLO|nr:unnamed protein product [Ostreobium quekettii]|eukprot:evm.model.scf_322.8 EVM.evm.TU.scf_322.8   scf_322:100693-101061(+)